MLRALHRLVDAEPWVIDDPVSLALFGDAVRATLHRQPGWFQDERSTALRTHVLLQSAFAEARLHAAILRGVRQYVVLGAGFDTFAYRQPAWMDGMRVFEVDAKATQADKIERLALAGVATPSNVFYAAIDFEQSSLDEGLSAAGFDAGSPAFFSWLGVMVYLTRDAIEAVFRYVATLSAGSEIAFTFTQPDANETLARRVAELGEPMRTRIDALELDSILGKCGFRGAQRLTANEAVRILGVRHDRLRLPSRESIATAVVLADSRVYTQRK